ncbi:MAG TPA: alpha/beta hydrolase [Terricaulis sp.]|nr:alpha/beta hydrolase [Terricaulis sp.]
MMALQTFLRASGVAALLALTAGCVSIGAFNRFTPHDPGARQVASGLAYGEGPRRTLDVYAPAAGAEGAPVLVFIYGGGWRSGAKEDHSFIGDAFAAHGFVTVIPDYRLAPETQFPGFVDDAAQAIAWVEANIAAYGGDPRRIVLAGHSAGAYNAMMAALDVRYAAAAGFDPRAIRGVVGLAGPYGFYFNNPIIRTAFGDAPDPANMHAIGFARADAPPLLLLTGDADRRVPVRASEEMAEAARAAGGQAQLIIYPGLDHPGILQALAPARRNRAPVFADALAFAERVTR